MGKEEYVTYEQKMSDYIDGDCIEAEITGFDTSCHSVEDAVSTVGCKPDELVKNICMYDSTLDRLIVAIVLGNSKVSRKKVARAINAPMPEFATQAQIESMTGYLVGGVPPFGYNAMFIIDEEVMKKEFVFASAGSPYALMKIPPSEILKANEGMVYNIGKK